MKTILNNNLNLNDVGKELTLYGWVKTVRNQGFIKFIDLRDKSGIIQLSLNDKFSDVIKSLKKESVIKVHGVIKERISKNPNIDTGDIELVVDDLEILNLSNDVPFMVDDKNSSLEETRLAYRYLELRRKDLQDNLKLRHQVFLIIRNYLDELGFTEVETPILSKPTPEGARDYLVPSRIYNGSFFALPQSPQIYKQLLMIGGLERYFQIARCFRDEDLRSDRQPEFTQLDMEMSFVNEEEIFEVVESLMKKIWKDIKNIELNEFSRMKYDDAFNDYGSDKPDLRFGMKLQDITDICQGYDFEMFQNETINAIVLRDKASEYSRKGLDNLSEEFKKFSKLRLLSLKYEENELKGGFIKLVDEKFIETIKDRLELNNNDIIFICCGKNKEVKTSLGFLRKFLGDIWKLAKEEYKFTWITDFPMFEYEDGVYSPAHHPFTSPRADSYEYLLNNKEKCYSRSYDLVLNGVELLSGSIRIHDRKLQEQVFEAIGLSKEKAEEKFGFFLDAFKYGAPPHGGVGIGLDRLLMILLDTHDIKDVVAFPKTQTTRDLMSSSPNKVFDEQLDILGIGIKDEIK